MPCNMLAVVTGQVKNLDALFSSEQALIHLNQVAATLLDQPTTIWPDGEWIEGYRQWRRGMVPHSHAIDAVNAKQHINFTAVVGSLQIERNGAVSCRDGWNQAKIPTNAKDIAAAAHAAVAHANAYATIAKIIEATGQPADGVSVLDGAVVGTVNVNGVVVYLIAGYDGSFMCSVAPDSAQSFDAASAAIQAVLPAVNQFAETGQVEQHAHTANMAHETVHQL